MKQLYMSAVFLYCRRLYCTGSGMAEKYHVLDAGFSFSGNNDSEPPIPYYGKFYSI